MTLRVTGETGAAYTAQAEFGEPAPVLLETDWRAPEADERVWCRFSSQRGVIQHWRVLRAASGLEAHAENVWPLYRDRCGHAWRAELATVRGVVCVDCGINGHDVPGIGIVHAENDTRGHRCHKLQP